MAASLAPSVRRWLERLAEVHEGLTSRGRSHRVGGAAYKREGAAVTMRHNVYRMADANKAFAHFAW
jgi:small subunit ribosomal protein S7